jgi:hypothetical protein
VLFPLIPAGLLLLLLPTGVLFTAGLLLLLLLTGVFFQQDCSSSSS